MPAQVLLIDDDPAVRSSIAFALEAEGFAVNALGSAAALLGLGPGARHACIVLDHRLPGVNGPELLAALRARGDRRPAIVIASHPTSRLRAQIAAAGATLIEKPLLCDALTAAIRRMVSPAERTA